MAPVIEFEGVVKDYHALRPLRLRELRVAPAETVAIDGLDAQAAEVFTGLVTGAIVPDEGRVVVLGQDTSAVSDADVWLAGLDRFGIVSDRVAVLDGFTVAQNIALPLTLDLDELTQPILATVQAVAKEAGLARELLSQPAGALEPLARFRLGLAKALAAKPRILLVEHPGAGIGAPETSRLGSTVSRLVRARGMACVIMTALAAFARAADRSVVLDPATGVLKGGGLRAWFSR